MTYIKNYSQIAITPQRKLALDMVEAAYQAIQPANAVQKNISIQQNILHLADQQFSLDQYQNIYLVGFGKGSAEISKLIEQTLGSHLTAGWVNDVTPADFTTIKSTLGTHPLPSQANLDFTQQVISELSDLSDNDLVIMVTCGGGSALFELPHTLDLEGITAVNKALLRAGATISQMNTIRKHLSQVKGGGFAKILHPATVANLLFSDVPGNDLNVIASGPTVKDPTTLEQAVELFHQFDLGQDSPLTPESFAETPKEDQYFANIHNILILSNDTALEAMQAVAQEKGQQVVVHSNHFESEANQAAQKLLTATPDNTVLLAGGETTVTVSSDANGQGGRNQEVVLAALKLLQPGQLVISFASDGWDNTPVAGAIADQETQQHTQDNSLDVDDYLQRHDSLAFFTQTGDTIDTGRLPSNVSDLYIVIKS